MSISDQQREHLVALTTALFDAPPGADFLREFEGYLEGGMSLGQLALSLTSTPVFAHQYAGLSTTEEKVDKALATLGVEPHGEAYEAASEFFAESLAAGREPAALLVEAAEFLYGTDDPVFSDAAATFLNKVEVGVYHSVEKGVPSGSLEELQAVYDGVTSDPATVASAKEAIDDSLPDDGFGELAVALTTVMFNAPPGAEVLEELSGYLRDGLSLAQIADNLAATTVFESQFEGLESGEEKINQVLENFGIDSGSAAYSEAFAFFSAGLAAGRSPGALLVEAGEFIFSTDSADFADIGATLKNKLEVGVYHSIEKGMATGSLEELQSVYDGVTADPATVEAAKRVIDGEESGDPDENAAPTAIALDGQAIVAGAEGAELGQLIVEDPDAGDTHTFALEGDDRFEIEGDTLRLRESEALASGESVELMLTATDAEGESVTETFVVGDGFLVTGGGADVIRSADEGSVLRAGGGVDTMLGGDGDDTFVIVGDVSSGGKVESADTSEALGFSITDLNGQVLNEDADGGAGIIDGGGGNNTLYVIGDADLSNYELINIETVEIRSSVVFDAKQLEEFISLTGDGSSSLRIRADEPTTFKLGEGVSLAFLGEVDLGEGVTLEIDSLDVLGGARILSGSGTLSTTSDLGSMAGYTLTSSLTVEGSDASEARRVDTVSSAPDEDGVITGTDGNDYLMGTAGDDILDGLDGDDILVGLGGRDTYRISGTGEKTIIDSGRNSVLDLSLADGPAVVDLTDGGIIGGGAEEGGATILLGTGTGATGLQPLDIMLSQDLSGSFSNDLATIRSTGFIDDLIDGVRAIQPNSAFGVASYVDKPMSPFGSAWSNDYEYRTDAPLSLDPEVLRAAYDDMVIKSGGDGPESQLTALLQMGLRAEDPLAFLEDGSVDMDATGLGYRPDALRTLILLTDADYHEAGDGEAYGLPPNNGDRILDGDPLGTGEDYPSIDQVREALEASSIYPVFAVTSWLVPTYEDLVDELGFGAVVELESDSSNLVEVLTSSLEDYKADFVAELVGTDFDDQLTGNSLSNTIDGGAGDDWIYGLGGNNTLTGGEGADTFVLGFAGTSRGVTTITDFSAEEGDLIALDRDGLIDFSDITDEEEMFATRDGVADLEDGDDGLVILQEEVSAEDLAELTASASVEAYVMAFNSDSGMAEMWFDADWSDEGGREQVASFESLDELAMVVGLSEDHFTLAVA